MKQDSTPRLDMEREVHGGAGRTERGVLGLQLEVVRGRFWLLLLGCGEEWGVWLSQASGFCCGTWGQEGIVSPFAFALNVRVWGFFFYFPYKFFMLATTQAGDCALDRQMFLLGIKNLEAPG